MQDNPFVKITDDATKEALLAQRAYQIQQQRDRVERLQEQVNDRLDALRNRTFYVAGRVREWPHGAFGHDTATLDDLLRVLAEEAESLANMEAAEEATDRLTEKYEAMMSAVSEQRPEPVPAGAGQYL